MLAKPLEREWRQALGGAERVLAIDDSGITLGKTLIASFHKGRLAIDFDRVTAMLSGIRYSCIRRGHKKLSLCGTLLEIRRQGAGQYASGLDRSA